MSAARVTDAHAVELLSAIVNHDGTNATFGVAATVDRWDGRTWLTQGRIAMCLDLASRQQGHDGERRVRDHARRRSGCAAASRRSTRDLDQATSSGPHVATIERWRAGEWTAVHEMRLRVVQAPVEWTGVMPSLPRGEYCLVRRAPGGDFIGHFWTVDSAE